MKISVAMTTYNGSKHIEEQLNSILCQTRRPDEVVICDDKSTDDTVNKISDFITKHKLTNWIIVLNEVNIGWKKNFRKAITMSSGDIIFFADQDDVWIDDKIMYMSSLMKEYDMGCLYGESIKISEDGQLNQELNSVNHFSGHLMKIQYSRAFYSVGGLGCCMCINRRVANKYLELNVEEDKHDSQCSRIALLYDTLWHVDKAVINYRVYPGNTSGISDQYSFGTSDTKQRIEDIELIIKWLKAVENDVKGDYQSDIKAILEVLDKRENYLKGGSVRFVSLISYYKYYSGLTMLLGDFSYRHNWNRSWGKLRWKIDKLRVLFKRSFQKMLSDT